MRATASPADHLTGRSGSAGLSARWPVPLAGPDLRWAGLCLCCCAAAVAAPSWQFIPCAVIWISLAARCAVSLCSPARALMLAVCAAIAGGAGTGWDIRHAAVRPAALAEGPLLAVMFALLIWSQHRSAAAPAGPGRRPRLARATPSSAAARMSADQRRFLEDTSHQLRAPITIALGHAELLAGQLSGQQGGRDIDVVVGELERLRRLSDRLLLITASENPDFLRTEQVELDMLAADRLLSWQAAAPRAWAAGRLDPVLADADPERLRLALDALLENAVQHTTTGQPITMSVTREQGARFAVISVADGGEGMAASDLSRVFDRFTTGRAGARGTGLGLPLAQAIARGHGGEVRVHSCAGQGSQFDLLLPILPGAPAGELEWDSGSRDDALPRGRRND